MQKYEKTLRVTIFEAISFNRELLERLSAAGISPDDCRYIDLFNEFNALVGRGEKVSYAVAILAEKYGVSERQVYKVVKRLRSAVPPLQ